MASLLPLGARNGDRDDRLRYRSAERAHEGLERDMRPERKRTAAEHRRQRVIHHKRGTRHLRCLRERADICYAQGLRTYRRHKPEQPT